MRRRIVPMILSLALGGCAPALVPYEVRVSGTTADWFATYSLQDGSGQMVTGTVAEPLPARFSLRGRVVSFFAQKRSRAGTLRVEMFRGDEMIAESETAAAFGNVSVTSTTH